MTIPPDPALVERFRADLLALAARHPGSRRNGRLALAVSGGPDSMAMLALAQAAFPGQVIAATVDHGLREAAREEARMVAGHCAALGIAHAILEPAGPIRGSSLQMRAREARYARLVAWADDADAPVLLTAHHADDQAETLLMRLARGSGIGGLSAIRAARPEWGVWVMRPLLGWQRGELRAVCEATDTPFVDDPSNDDDRHDRTRFRALLAREPLLDPTALTASAAWLAEADATLQQIAEAIWAERWQAGLAILSSAGDQPREIRRRLLRLAIHQLRATHGIEHPSFGAATNIEPLLDALESGQRATQGSLMVTPRGTDWHFAPAPPRRSH